MFMNRFWRDYRHLAQNLFALKIPAFLFPYFLSFLRMQFFVRKSSSTQIFVWCLEKLPTDFDGVNDIRIGPTCFKIPSPPPKNKWLREGLLRGKINDFSFTLNVLCPMFMNRLWRHYRHSAQNLSALKYQLFISVFPVISPYANFRQQIFVFANLRLRKSSYKTIFKRPKEEGRMKKTKSRHSPTRKPPVSNNFPLVCREWDFRQVYRFFLEFLL